MVFSTFITRNQVPFLITAVLSIACFRKSTALSPSMSRNHRIISHTYPRSRLMHLSSSSSDSESSTEDGEASDSSSCPFSMKYPRYRVPVSSGKEDYSAKGGGLFAGIKMSLDRSTVERRYGSDVEKNGFSFVEPDMDVSDDDERIARGKIGVFVTSVIWRKAADLIDDCIAERSTSSSPRTRRSVISIPNASLVGLQQISDILHWYNEQQKEQTVHAGDIIVEACVEKETPIPTIILTATINEGRITSASASASTSKSTHTTNLNKQDQTSEQIIGGTKSWVKRVLVELGICPFTKSVTKSGQGLTDVGISVGNIAYHHSSARLNEIPHLMADTWEAIYKMIQAGPSGRDGISSILLADPEFDNNFPVWAGPVFAMLEASVVAAKAEPLIGVVCFHPQYMSPNGQSWPGFGHMHSVPRLRKWLTGQNEQLSSNLDDVEVAAGGSYQRRTPYATINVLRAEQLEAAEGKRTTANLYARNIEVLHEYGFDQLEKDIAVDKALL